MSRRQAMHARWWTVATTLLLACRRTDVLVVAAGESSSGIIWLAEGCTGSTTLRNVTLHLATRAFPSRRVVDKREAWRLAHANGAHVFETTQFLDPGEFSIAKVQPVYITGFHAYDFRTAPLDFTLVGMKRSNPLEFLACALRDNAAHGLCGDSFSLDCLHDMGYVVDADGRRVFADAPAPPVGESKSIWKANRLKLKDEHRAYLDPTKLRASLDYVASTNHAKLASILATYDQPSTVWESRDLLEWGTDDLRRASAHVWHQIMSQAGATMTLDQIDAELKTFDAPANRPPPCSWAAYSTKIANVDEVFDVLRNDHVWGNLVTEGCVVEGIPPQRHA